MHEDSSRVTLYGNKMKNLARLTIFFSLCFAVLFLAAIMLGFLSSWIDMAKVIPTGAKPGEDVTELAWKALPAALYLSILLSLSLSARRNMRIPLTLVCILVLGCVFTAGVSLGISRAGVLKPALQPISPIEGRPGLILSRADNTIILLKRSNEIRGSRVVSIPGRPLIYQEVPVGPNNTILNLPALPFGEDTPWLIRSLNIDFSLCAGELKTRLGDSFVSFGAYAFSLILLLASLRFLLELSQWPLANLFLGALVFRLILTLEIFLNTREISALIGSFLTGRVPPMLITPLVFGALAVLIIIYTLLTRIARGSPEIGPGPRRERDV